MNRRCNNQTNSYSWYLTTNLWRSLSVPSQTTQTPLPERDTDLNLTWLDTTRPFTLQETTMNESTKMEEELASWQAKIEVPMQ